MSINKPGAINLFTKFTSTQIDSFSFESFHFRGFLNNKKAALLFLFNVILKLIIIIIITNNRQRIIELIDSTSISLASQRTLTPLFVCVVTTKGLFK